MSLNLREFELRVVRIHALDLFPCWSTQNLQGAMTKHQNIVCMNETCPSRSSAMTQPVDHKSMAVVYSVAPNMSSGAL
ncbi:Os03g0841850 [Oryza sativa Japonica Group]|uniref:Os03g0841850 protein n=1 Tax=Oryza sativa subsp. japonica TaxID=39947 RepID=A0A0P0W5F6_ORYSJ|nr:hypothetical protein EE612_021591 [Oryza sativa]BAS87302.1 Os03g0841850 [Oryza sativa Japonica Group]